MVLMKILFNLAGYRSQLAELNKNDIGVANDIMHRVCSDNGFPVENKAFDPNQSLIHGMVFENIKDYVEEKLFCVPTTDIAHLADLGNLQFQLTIHNRK